MAGLDELLHGMRAALEQRVKHLVTNQPLLTERVRGEIDPVALPHPPAVGDLAAQGDGARGRVHRVEGDLRHVAAQAGAFFRLDPPRLVKLQCRHVPRALDRRDRGGTGLRRGAGRDEQREGIPAGKTHRGAPYDLRFSGSCFAPPIPVGDTAVLAWRHSYRRPVMLSRIRSAAVLGIDAFPVEVEVDISSGLPSFSTVGLPNGAVKEGRERVSAALGNAGFQFPLRRITVNLAPADIRKDGSALDLPIALGLLLAS